MTAAGKALLAEQADADRLSYLRRRDADEREMVDHFLGEIEEIRTTRIATNRINKRFAIATCVRNLAGTAVAAVTLVGAEQVVKPNVEELRKTLLKAVGAWSKRSGGR
jgi:DNA-binding IclR family transcriptional regulator